MSTEDDHSNVVALRTGVCLPLPPAQPADTDATLHIVNMLKRTAVMAKDRGDLVGLSIVWATKSGAYGHKEITTDGCETGALMAALQIALHYMMSNVRSVDVTEQEPR